MPFIARYRKEVTGGLDDTQLRKLEERLGYLRELEERRTAILASIERAGQAHAGAARRDSSGAETKQRLEDLYLPYKPKRRTKAQIAREAGLEPLADALLADPTLVPETEAAKYLRPAFTAPDGENPGVPDAKAALEGARQILMEQLRRGRRAARAAARRTCVPKAASCRSSPRARRPRARSSATTSTTASRCATCRRTARWRCSAAAARKCCASR